jgi:hypothetical protein
MNLSNVELINFVDKSRVEDDHPSLTIQRIIRIPSIHVSSGMSEVADDFDRKVLSLTQKHWKIFDTLLDKHNVQIETLFGTVARYQKMKPGQFDQALEFCLEAIDNVFDLSEGKDLGLLSKAWDQDDGFSFDADQSVLEKTIH